MTVIYDLHSHSSASDGTQSPAALVTAARAAGVDVLALTDHDTIAGLDEAGHAAREAGLRLIPGIELSCTWERKTLHVLGLNIDPAAPRLGEGLAELAGLRQARARRIDAKLAKAGIAGLLAGLHDSLGPQTQITRSHFARALVTGGHVKTPAEAFKRYLGRGKPAAVASDWPALESVIGWILAAGGTPVLAHPLRYQLSASWLRRLLAAFAAAGGQGLEVVCGRGTVDEIRTLALYASRYGLAASAGSDYHGEATPWLTPGQLAPLPAGLTPVWDLWEAA